MATSSLPTSGPFSIAGLAGNTGPTQQNLPGVGTLTIAPKNLPALADKTAPDNTAGLYARTGVAPAAPLTAPTPGQATNANNGVYKDAQNNVFEAGTNRAITPAEFQAKGYNIDHINTQAQLPPVAPKFPSETDLSGDSTKPPSILDSYTALVKQLGDIATKIGSNSEATAEEKQLAQELNAKKASLDQFDTETLQRAEAYRGQGRGQTNQFIALNVNEAARTRALQRLGLAKDVTNDTNQLALLQKNRADLTDAEKTQYDLTSKQVDLAMNVSKEMDRLDQEHQTKARQYLLDVVNFAGGKTYDQLDPATQAQIITSVANSPITLGMIKSALDASQKGVTYETREVGGRVIRFGFDAKGQELSKTDLGSTKGNSRGSSGSDIFTETQLNKGAANANIPISDFKNLDSTSQNYFINNKPDIKQVEDLISEAKAGSLKNDEAKFNKNPGQIKSAIDARSDLPGPVKDYLVKHLNSTFPNQTSANSSQPLASRFLGLIKGLFN